MKNLLLTLALLLWAVSAQAATTFYVKASCSNGITTYEPTGDTCTGGSATVYSTIQNGIAALTPGAADILDIRTGTYAENISSAVQTIPSGTSWTDAATIRAHTGETVTITSISLNVATPVITYLKFEGLFVSQGIWIGGQTGGPHHIRFTDLDATSTTYHVVQWGGVAHHIEWIGGSVHNSPGNLGPTPDPCGGTAGQNWPCYGMYLGGTDNLVEGAKIHSNFGYGIHQYTGVAHTANRNVYRYNEIYNNGTGDASQGSSCALLMTSGDDNVAHSNLIRGNDDQGLCIGSGDRNAAYNNTIVSNGGLGMVLKTTTDGSQSWINNISYGNSGDWQDWGGGFLTGVTRTTNHCANAGTGCITTGDPLFTDSGALDFSLAAKSPALDVATVLGAPFAFDYDGFERTTNWDIGALERHTAAATWELVISSTTPASLAAMSVVPVSPYDGDCSANTPIASGACTWDDGDTVTISAAATATGGNVFTSWTGCNEVGLGSDDPKDCTVIMSSARTVTANYTDPPTGDNVAWWKLDDGGGSADDSSANSNTGTLTGAGGLPTWTTERGVSTLTFDKVDDSVNVAASATLNFNTTNAFSFIAVVKPTSTTGWQAIIIGDYLWGMYASIGDGAYCGNGNPIIFFASAGGTIFWVVCHNAPLSTTVETVIGGTYDGDQLIMYRQGKEVARATSGAVIDDSSASAVTIGRSTSFGEYFGGEIRNVKVWNIALTAAQMAAEAPSRIAFGGKIAGN